VTVSSADRLKRDKRALRARVRAARDALSPDARLVASRTIADTVLSLPEIASASCALVFASFGTEVDTAPIVEGLVERGVRVALPRVEGRDLVPIAFRPGDPLVEAGFGMPEPAGDETVALQDLDAVVTPGLAFDRAGYRVGYGGGFYDRLFADAGAGVARIGVCFSVQLVDHAPRGAFDAAVDVVVTEREVVRTG
jgi:5-formyltetrahydrofolate cyclo-ligase